MPKMLYIISEGRTESAFVKNTLAEHLLTYDWIVQPITLPTGNSARGVRKGGWRRSGGYKYATKEIWRTIVTHRNAVYTTFFDLYGFPKDIPCYNEAKSLSSPQEKAQLYERQLKEDVAILFDGDANYRSDFFLPYIQPYEFECFLFIDPKCSATELFNGNIEKTKELESKLASVAYAYETPEHINDGSDTAPSKRIEGLVPGFIKNKAGKSGFSWKIAKTVGIQRIRDKCPHFNEWLSVLEKSNVR